MLGDDERQEMKRQILRNRIIGRRKNMREYWLGYNEDRTFI